MSTFKDEFQTHDGIAFVKTSPRWMGMVPMPNTGVTPQNALDLKSLGTFIQWNTKEPLVLGMLHREIVEFVKNAGMTGLRALCETVKHAEGVCEIAGFRMSIQDFVEQAKADGVEFPLPDNVVEHLKGFK